MVLKGDVSVPNGYRTGVGIQPLGDRGFCPARIIGIEKDAQCFFGLTRMAIFRDIDIIHAKLRQLGRVVCEFVHGVTVAIAVLCAYNTPK